MNSIDLSKKAPKSFLVQFDYSGNFRIRKGLHSRLRYDYEERLYGGRPIRVWNKGTPDQFEEKADR